jgi:hypothetical protein
MNNKFSSLLALTILSMYCFMTSLSYAQDVPIEQVLAQDLVHFMPNSRYEEVQAGEQTLPIVINTSNVPISKGAAILISDIGHGQLGSKMLGPLITNLNDHGWNTVATFSPSIGLSYEIQLNPDLLNNEDETTSIKPYQSLTSYREDNFTLHEQQMQLFMNSVMERAEQYPGFALVIAEGTSAAWLTKLYAQGDLRIPDSLVVISPFWPDPEFNEQLPELVLKAPPPILDIVSQWDNKWALHTRQARLKSATVGLKPKYRQRELIGLPHGQNQAQYLTKEIVGWTNYLGW